MSNKKILEKINSSIIPDDYKWLVDELKILIDANERFQDTRKAGVRIIHSECCERK